ncbi:cytochrome b/b6 domain-containing protein [Peredibacter starrii]|uniref:Cytochrome b/b6 domain-containing protein n=1 Tax=Peredibacter starrii TaxID=28202 RepID=A0AAX4HN91_9BACT|nr:cytochrome b/b6 domain-containing protein [Peredibacter starrii]WPU64792.1 cytochrome b/b6 domain-containing protein [Peredibacter starrii]
MKFIEKHSRILRICHWFNFFFLFLMIWSGILIYWAHQAYIVVPENVAEQLGIDHRLAEGMGWHFFIMWPFALNGIVYVVYLALSGDWKFLFPDRQSFREVIPVVLHDLKLRSHAPPIRGKYNAAQRVAYFMVILMGLGSLLTGLAIYKPVQVGWLTALLGGYPFARFLHFILMLGFVFFFIIHVIQVLRAGWNNLRSMIAGYEIE